MTIAVDMAHGIPERTVEPKWFKAAYSRHFLHGVDGPITATQAVGYCALNPDGQVHRERAVADRPGVASAGMFRHNVRSGD